MPKKTKAIIPVETIPDKIIYLRGERVLLDSDLAKMYGVETRVLKQAVRRNIDRFPGDFMFELTKKELDSLRSQFVTLKRGQHTKYPPFAFFSAKRMVFFRFRPETGNKKRKIQLILSTKRNKNKNPFHLGDPSDLPFVVQRAKLGASQGGMQARAVKKSEYPNK